MASNELILDNAQHIGEREEQQDAFGFSDVENPAFVANHGVLAVVADGMGGLERGAVASDTAVRMFLSAYAARSPQSSIGHTLIHALDQANRAVLSMAKAAGLEGKVGTTLVAAAVHEGKLYWISVGDSRLYLLRKGVLTRLTVDHVYSRVLAQAVAEGRIRRNVAENHPDRNALTSFLGLVELKEIDRNTTPFPLDPGDRLLLCSDGVYGSLSEEEMVETLNGSPRHDGSEVHSHRGCEALIQRVLDKGRAYQDNLTAVTLGYAPAPLVFDSESPTWRGDMPRHQFLRNGGIK